MVACELDKITIASVCIMQSLCMMRLNEVILFSRSEKSRNVGLAHMSDRCNFVQIKSGLGLDRACDKSHGSSNEERWDTCMCFGQFITKGPEV